MLGPDSLIHLAPGRKCAPDVFFIRQERVPMPLPKEFEGVPELVVEVLSPSNRRYDLRDKRLIYREAGVGEVWFIDAELRRIIVDRRQAGSYVEEIVTAGQVCFGGLARLLVERFLVVGHTVAEPFHVPRRDSARNIDESPSHCLASSLRTPAASPLFGGQMAAAMPSPGSTRKI